jgi:hypothetical protein
MMEAAQRLLAGDDNTWLDPADTEELAQVGASKESPQRVEKTDAQLRLL